MGEYLTTGETFRDRKENVFSAALTEELKIVLPVLKLIEADVCFNGDPRAGVTKVRIIARDNGETFPLWLPREIRDGV
jgi:hypothetical protein